MDSRHKLLLRTAVVIGLLALASCKKSSKPGESSGDNAKPRTAASPAPGDGKAAQPPLITRLPGEPVPVSHGVMLDIGSDHGAQLLLMDSQGRRTGYDPAAKQKVDEIAGASYVNESITDATDSSDSPAEAGSRVLHVNAGQGSSYLLRVAPAGRTEYHLGVRCMSEDGRSRMPAAPISIGPGEVHQFIVAANARCAGASLSGAIVKRSTESRPLLSYAWPPAANVRVPKDHPARIVVVYDKEIAPSSFAATLNGQPVTQLFHPEPGRVESVVLPARAGQNTVELKAVSSVNSANTASDRFVFVVE